MVICRVGFFLKCDNIVFGSEYVGYGGMGLGFFFGVYYVYCYGYFGNIVYYCVCFSR